MENVDVPAVADDDGDVVDGIVKFSFVLSCDDAFGEVLLVAPKLLDVDGIDSFEC